MRQRKNKIQRRKRLTEQNFPSYCHACCAHIHSSYLKQLLVIRWCWDPDVPNLPSLVHRNSICCVNIFILFCLLSFLFHFTLVFFLLMDEVLLDAWIPPSVAYETLQRNVCLITQTFRTLSVDLSLVLLCNHGRVICDITSSLKLDMFAFHIFLRERNQLWQSNDLHIIVLNKKVTMFSPEPESGITAHLTLRSTL